jgi:hypothetical protein
MALSPGYMVNGLTGVASRNCREARVCERDAAAFVA